MNLDHLFNDKKGYSLVDLSQIALATAMQTYEAGMKFTVPEVRHMVLATLRLNVATFKAEGFENVVICTDNASKGYWRRQVADYYKRNRAIKREETKDDFDWDGFFEALKIVIQEIKDFMPYAVLNIDYCEADDCIAVMTKYLVSKGFKVRIISSDGDFTQLHCYDDVDQWSPMQKKFVKVKTSSPEEDCLTKIVKGDKKDCVASIKVRGNFYITNEASDRTPMTTAEFITSLVGKSELELSEIFNDDIVQTIFSPKSGKKWITDELKKFQGENYVEIVVDKENKDYYIDQVYRERAKYHLVSLYGLDAEKVSVGIQNKSISDLIDLILKCRIKRFKENQILIDFNYIRDDIQKSILDEFESIKVNPRGKMYSYFVKNQLVKLLPQINTF